jgi:hypothetical protein
VEVVAAVAVVAVAAAAVVVAAAAVVVVAIAVIVEVTLLAKRIRITTTPLVHSWHLLLITCRAG